MKYLAVMLLLLSCHTSAPSTIVTSTPESRAISQMVSRTVYLEASCAEGEGSGSGVVLDNFFEGSLIATAAHVADPSCSLSYKSKPAWVLKVDKKHDLALLYIPGVRSVSPLRLGTLYLGQNVIAVGYPLQFFTRKSALQVSKGQAIVDYGVRIRITAPIYFGSSGGPVFDESGRLVGIVTSMQAIGGVVPVEYYMAPAAKVYEMVDSLKKTLSIRGVHEIVSIENPRSSTK